MFAFEPEFAAGFSLDGSVKNANASFSVLNGSAIKTPVSSPSVTRVILAPGYLDFSSVFAFSMSAGLRPVTEVELPSIKVLGKRNFRPMLAGPPGVDPRGGADAQGGPRHDDGRNQQSSGDCP